MSLKRWFVEQEPQWERLEALLAKSAPSARSLSPGELREMGFLYRGVLNDLSRVQSTPEYKHLEPYLNNLAQRCHGHVYEKPPTRGKDILDFFMVSFPRCFRKNSLFIGLAFAMFAVGTALAMLTVHFNPETQHYFLPEQTIDALRRGVLWTDIQQANPSQSSFLMTNNIRVAINAYTLGVFFGVGTLLLMLHNGMFALGGPLQVCIANGMGSNLLRFIIAHGVVELTTIFIAGGAGMMIGFAMLFPGDYPRWTAVRLKARESLVLIMGCFPMLVVAGLIEGLISLNNSIPLGPRIAIAIVTAVGLTGYLGYSGREAKPGRTGASAPQSPDLY